MFVRSHCDRKRYFTLRLLCTWRCSGISGWCSANLRKVGRWQPLPTDTTTGGRAVFSHWLSGESAVPGETLNLVIFGVPKTVKSDNFEQNTSYVRTLKNTDCRINVQVRLYENSCFCKYAQIRQFCRPTQTKTYQFSCYGEKVTF